MNGFQTLRVNVLAAPIDITAAGTSAPSAIAEKQKPANQSGESPQHKLRHRVCRRGDLEPAAIAIMPSSAIRPSTKE